jgi:DNA-binding SARP family transcriptional activator
VSLVDNISGEQSQLLAVLYCDICARDARTSAESEIALWRARYQHGAVVLAAEYNGHETSAAAFGWALTFDSTIDALLCARELSSLVGRQRGGPSLSGGLSAGAVTRDAFGIGGVAVGEAIALCRRALPWQVLIADPLKMVVSERNARSFAPAVTGVIADIDSGPFGATVDRYGWRAPSLRLVTTNDPVASEATAQISASVGTVVLRPTTVPPVTHRADLPRTLPAATGERAGDLASNQTRLNILGWVQLDSEDSARHPVVLRGTQARTVLSMLALRRGPVHREELADMLWPGGMPGHWEGALRGLITKVRRFLDAGGLASKEVLVGDGGYYELRLPPGATVDRDHARALTSQAEQALSTGRSSEAVALACQAAAILERQLLSGPNDAWFDQVRAELAHDRMVALELWARADLAAGGTDGAIRAATEALALDPYRESSFRLLMQAHSSAGSRGEALRTYEQCRRMLAEELGVGPSPQTQALYIHLLG